MSGTRRLRLTLQYDGAAFHGWQVQPALRTVQAELESALERLTTHPIRVAAAGRTDRGAHASGQVVSFDLPAKWRAPELLRALNAVLPDDVRVTAATEPRDAAFHARFSAIGRAYVYRVATSPAGESPFLRRWCWPAGCDVDVARLEVLAATLAGERSFAAFAKAGQQERGDRCTVHRAAWRPWSAGVQLEIVANRFLHHMVRYLVGTMVDVARARRPAGEWDALLAGDAAVTTSPPAPPEGLFLARVYYDANELNGADRFDEDLPR